MGNYPKWNSIPRLYNETFAITEKIDGTNGLIYIENDDNTLYGDAPRKLGDSLEGLYVYAGSRKRWITPEQDNHGFAAWVYGNAEALAALGPGYHYGEWAGPGIRGNRHGLEEKIFFLFNWRKYYSLKEGQALLPDSVRVVPVLETDVPAWALGARVQALTEELEESGSQAGPGLNPEGVVVRSDLTGQQWKYFCGGFAANRTPKGGSHEDHLRKFNPEAVAA